MKLARATVKWFNTEKRFGFLVLEGTEGDDLFFHYGDGQMLKAVGNRLEWCLPPRGRHLRDPKQGDAIVFEHGRDARNRKKAAKWTYQGVYDDAQSRVVEPVLYRVMIQYSYPGSGKEDATRKEWEGTDLSDRALNMVWDPRYDRSTFSCGDYSSVKWFERKVGNDWIRCNDPRSH